MDLMTIPRFGMGRFAHWLAIESRELNELNESSPRSLLHNSSYRVPGIKRSNGTLVVLNKWGHSPELFRRIGAVLPPGPVALLYGDDTAWIAEDLEPIRRAFPPSRPLVRHFAMNLDTSALALPHTRQVPIGLNRMSVVIPKLLAQLGTVAPQARSRTLVCCCARAWRQRVAAFEALRAAGHVHCNLSQRLPFERLFHLYQTSRFVASPYGHGHTDFREFEALTAGAVPIVSLRLSNAQRVILLYVSLLACRTLAHPDVA